MTVAMMLFTRDLRLTDNPALAAAVDGSAAVVPAFVLDDAILARFAGHASRLAFLYDSLRDLDAGLRAAGGGLVIRRGPWRDTVIELARQTGVSVIHVADDVSGYAQARLAALEEAAAAHRIGVVRHPGVLIVAAGAVRPAGGSAYQVFTPYYRRWQQAVRRPPAATTARKATGGTTIPARWPPGSRARPGSPWSTRGCGSSRRRVSYVRRYVPELAGLPAAVIHDPDAAARRRRGYPAPLVDHRAAIREYQERRREMAGHRGDGGQEKGG